jgi:hypothetical protein
MTINVSVIAAAVASAFSTAEAVVTEFEALKPYAVALMDAAETAFTTSQTSGQNKLNSVLASLKAIAASIGVTWSTGLESALSALISAAKSAYNAFIAVVPAVTGSAS